MANWETEHFVKITPRRKNDWGFASIGNDYNNFESAEEYNAYYEKQTEIYQGATNDLYDNYDLDDAQRDVLDKMNDDVLKCLNEYKAQD